jgi:tetratricopeptide (TPR) repeat protein
MLNNLGVIAQERSRWDESLGLYRRSLDLFERIGDRTTASLAKFNISEILLDQGRYGEAEALLKEVLRVWQASGAELDLAAARAELGSLRARRGDLADARELLDTARTEQARVGNLSEVLTTDARIAEVLVLERDAQAALDLIDDALARARVTEGGSVVAPTLHRLRAVALAQAGRPDEAHEALTGALATARKRGDAHGLALILHVLAALARTSGSAVDELDRERAQLFESLGIVEVPAVPIGSLAQPIPG